MNTASSYSSLMKQKSQTMIDMALMLENTRSKNNQSKVVEVGDGHQTAGRKERTGQHHIITEMSSQSRLQ